MVAGLIFLPPTIRSCFLPSQIPKRAPDDPGLDRILRAAVKNDFPVNVLFWRNVDAGTALIDRHPDARFIIDHMGIQQPSTPPAPPQPWADLPKVVELVKRKNAVNRGGGFGCRRPLGSAPAIGQAVYLVLWGQTERATVIAERE